MKIKKYTALVLSVLTLMMAFMPAAMATTNYNSFSYFPQTQQGANNNYVRALQTVIKYHCDSSLANDGDFGSNTKAAVESYQVDYNLTCDGIVGTNTWNSLRSRLVQRYVGSGVYKSQIAVRNTGSVTNTDFFMYKIIYHGYVTEYNWSVYKAAPGTAVGTWYTVSSLYEA